MSSPAPTIHRSAVAEAERTRPRRVVVGSSRPLTSMARTTQYAAAVMSRTSIASGLSKRNMSAATGVIVTINPASRPAACPDQRRTAPYVRPTVPTPMRACGSSSENDEKPKIRADSPMTHKEAGGLSTVIALLESSEPNSHAFQSFDADFAAAA